LITNVLKYRELMGH